MRTILRKLKNEAGAEIAEAAMVLPIVFMFLLGIVWFGRAFNIYSTITQAAQQGAITAARATCATCGASADTFPTDAAVTGVVVAVMNSSNLDTSQILVSPNPASPSFCANPPNTCTTTGSNIKICRNVLLNPPASTQLPQCGAVVSFQYPFKFYLPFTALNLEQVVLSAEAQSRMEN